MATDIYGLIDQLGCLYQRLATTEHHELFDALGEILPVLDSEWRMAEATAAAQGERIANLQLERDSLIESYRQTSSERRANDANARAAELEAALREILSYPDISKLFISAGMGAVIDRAQAALQPRTAEVPTRNSALLAEFVAYCQQYPQFRFWQALRNWSGAGFIFYAGPLAYKDGSIDTFHWETRDGSKPRTAEPCEVRTVQAPHGGLKEQHGE